MPAIDPLRDHLVRLLDWNEAHAGFDKAVDGLAPDQRGVRPAGLPHSVWELVEHLRIAQADLLDFCVNATYVHDRTWPEDYWPKSPAPPDTSAWDRSLAAYRADREALERVIRGQPDLAALVPTGSGQQTYLRAVLLVADHAAYHVGQIVTTRRALGEWP
jgi:uncharacterized damage-inducible protein DinB